MLVMNCCSNEDAESAREVTLAFHEDCVQILYGNHHGYRHTNGMISFDRAGNVTYKEEAKQ